MTNNMKLHFTERILCGKEPCLSPWSRRASSVSYTSMTMTPYDCQVTFIGIGIS